MLELLLDLSQASKQQILQQDAALITQAWWESSSTRFDDHGLHLGCRLLNGGLLLLHHMKPSTPASESAIAASSVPRPQQPLSDIRLKIFCTRLVISHTTDKLRKW